ncbi:MAG: Sulfoquinovose 1-dehydrogenase [Nitrosomonadaceae bacterium]|nr:Sulfoquinovose 1-dehydrogenase [Nitrosomonadaceae bacterium]
MLTNKVIVVTGGAGLLGRQLCSAVVEHGGIVVVADVDGAGAMHVAEHLASQYQGRAAAASLDITSNESVTKLIAKLQKQYGRMDAVVNASYPRNRNYGRKLEDVTYEDFCENIGLHLGGYFLVAQQFGLFFRKQGAGNIVSIASIYGTMAPRFEMYRETSITMPVEYAAIKAAVVHLTRYFAQYFKGDGIRVNCISPGGIFDKQDERFLREYKAQCGNKGMLDPQDVNGCLLFLLSDASKYMTGQNLILDDGFSL